MHWGSTLLAIGHLYLPEVVRLVSAADTHRLVSPQNQFLCTALGHLGQVCYQTLGGREKSREVVLAGALLSLLTKVDDQVIDSRAFHGGISSRCAIEEKTRSFLAPTLQAIKTGETDDHAPRCLLAARLGRLLQDICGESERLQHVLELIARGWEIQVRAVAVLSSHPSRVKLEEVAQVTSEISGAWLLMIASLGILPADAKRMLCEDEEKSFFAWGYHIQRADALADFGKDLDDGLVSSFPGWLLYREVGEKYLSCAQEQLYRWLCEYEIDSACLPREGEITELYQSLAGLGEVPSLLHWIHGFLTWRYLRHKLCHRAPDCLNFAKFVQQHDSYQHYLGGVAQYLTEHREFFSQG